MLDRFSIRLFFKKYSVLKKLKIMCKGLAIMDFFRYLVLRLFPNFRSTDEEEVVALQPILIDYDNMCGSRLEFKVSTIL